MANIVPSARLVRRMMPGLVIEAVVMAACVILFVFTSQMFWIFVVVAAALAFGAWLVVMLMNHRDEWRWQGSIFSPRSGAKNGDR